MQQLQSQEHNPLISNNISNMNETIKNHLNPCISAATPLLTLVIQVKHAETPTDINKLRTQVINDIKKFEQKLLKLNYTTRTVFAARYCFCTAIDEAILNTPWGTNSIWVQQTLLSLFHNETWGGERFYIILENMIKEPRQNIDIIEFLYLLLSLGFEGKFFNKEKIIRDEIRNRIFHRIRKSRGKIEKSLSIHWKDNKPIEDNQHKKSSLKKLLLVTGFLLLSFFIGINYQAQRISSSTIQILNKIGLESPITAYSQLIDRPIIS